MTESNFETTVALLLHEGKRISSLKGVRKIKKQHDPRPISIIPSSVKFENCPASSADM